MLLLAVARNVGKDEQERDKGYLESMPKRSQGAKTKLVGQNHTNNSLIHKLLAALFTNYMSYK